MCHDIEARGARAGGGAVGRGPGDRDRIAAARGDAADDRRQRRGVAEVERPALTKPSGSDDRIARAVQRDARDVQSKSDLAAGLLAFDRASLTGSVATAGPDECAAEH